MKKSIGVGLLAMGLIIFSAQFFAQGTREDGTAAALVSELRQLRVAIENLTSVNSRMQILSIRGNQQEQRVSSLSSQLIPLKTKLAEAAAEGLFMASQLEQIKERIRFETNPELRANYEEEREHTIRNLESVRLKHSKLEEQVAELTQQTMTEQTRLTEVQQRLDDLERLLSPRR